MTAVPKRRRVLAFDCETTGLEPYNGSRMFAWATCDEEGECFVRRCSTEGCDEVLQRLLDDRSVELVAHNVKFEFSMLAVHGYRVPEWRVWHDTMLQSQMLDNLREANDLGYLGEHFLDWPQDLDRRIARMGREYGGYQFIPEHLMDEYQRSDVKRTMLLHQGFYPEIAKDALLLEDYRNEVDLARVTQRMEQRGIRLDIAETERLIADCARKAEGASNDLYSCTHERINIGSSKQLEWLLFTQLGYPRVENTRQETLDELRAVKDHQVFDCILRYRTYTKAAGMMRGYIERAVDGVLHPNIKTNHAATGREACDNPNLQNVGKDKKDGNPYAVPMRACFIPSEGRGLLMSDESGIEIRIGIEASHCRAMIEGMRRGEHPHVLAIRAFLQDESWRKTKETKPQYDTGKNGHFALMYGANRQKVLATLGYGSLEGIALYTQRYPEIATLVRSGLQRVKRNGYAIMTPFGRRLRISPQESYAWLNYEIQGTAAGIIKRAQVSAEKLRTKWGDGVRLILSIHDELMHDVDLKILNDTAARSELLRDINRCMTEIAHIQVPLEAEHKMATERWSKAVEIQP